MVLLADSVTTETYSDVVAKLGTTFNLTVVTEWREFALGFVCKNVSSADATLLAADPSIKLVEEDYEVSSSALASTMSTFHNNNYLWHLDRLDESTYAGHDGTYNRCPEGNSVVAYVIDTGVLTNHEQFMENGSSRVVLSLRFDEDNMTPLGVTDTTNACTDTPQPNYNNWHGTAVASVLGGNSIGASKPLIISLRPFTCGQFSRGSWIANAVQWVNGRWRTDPYRWMPSVVNMSLVEYEWNGDGGFGAVMTMVEAVVRNSGFPFFAAAGNFSADACRFAPAALAYTNTNNQGTVFTLGGTSLDGNGLDVRWQKPFPRGLDSGSNGGRCVSAYAPGADVYAVSCGYTTAGSVRWAFFRVRAVHAWCTRLERPSRRFPWRPLRQSVRSCCPSAIRCSRTSISAAV